MRLTREHLRALEAVRDGGSRDQLGDLVTAPEFVDLVNWQLIVSHYGVESDFWRLTDAGREALEAD